MDDLSGQVSDGPLIPFTDEELVEAFRLGSTLDEARQRVKDLRRSERAVREHHARNLERGVSSPALEGAHRIAPSAGVALSEADLVILSLLGESTRLKVERYRATMFGPRGIDPEVERQWQAEREQWRTWVMERRAEQAGG